MKLRHSVRFMFVHAGTDISLGTEKVRFCIAIIINCLIR